MSYGKTTSSSQVETQLTCENIFSNTLTTSDIVTTLLATDEISTKNATVSDGGASTISVLGNSLVVGKTTGSATLTNFGQSSILCGTADTDGSVKIPSASTRGTFCHGAVTDCGAGGISAWQSGSFVGGVAETDSNIVGLSKCALVHGHASSTSTMTAGVTGVDCADSATVLGVCDSLSEMWAGTSGAKSAAGAFAHGSCETSGSIGVGESPGLESGRGALAGGCAISTSVIRAGGGGDQSGRGSIAHGDAFLNSQITCGGTGPLSGAGSCSLGHASNSSTIRTGGAGANSAIGAFAHGSCNAVGTIECSGNGTNAARGAQTGGWALGSTGSIARIRAGDTGYGSGSGALVYGTSSSLGGTSRLSDIYAGGTGDYSGTCAVVCGSAYTDTVSGSTAKMYAGASGTSSGEGALVHGFVFNTDGAEAQVYAAGSNTNAGRGAFVGGCSSGGTCLLYAGGSGTNSGRGALVHGDAQTSSVISAGAGGNGSARGAMVIGSAVTSATISSGSTGTDSGRGSVTFGFATGGGSLISNGNSVTASGRGSLGGGSASGGGVIKIGGGLGPSEGCVAIGRVTGAASELSSNGPGCVALGSASTSGKLSSGTLSGSSDFVSTPGVGSVALGYVAGASNAIASYGNGSLVCGYAGAGSLRSGAHGSAVFASTIGGDVFVDPSATGALVACSMESAGTTVYVSGKGSVTAAHTPGGSTGGVLSSGNAALTVCSNASANTTTNAGTAAIVCGLDLENFASSNNYSLLLGQHGTASTHLASETPATMTKPDGRGSLQIAGGSSDADRGISVLIGTRFFGAACEGAGYARDWNVTGADYAEMFEYADGNVGADDRGGLFVALSTAVESGGKIVICNDTAEPLGVTTYPGASSGIVGDVAELQWANAGLRDDFGRPITELRYRQPLEEYCIREEINTETYEITPAITGYIQEIDDTPLLEGETRPPPQPPTLVELQPAAMGTRLTAAFVAQMDALDDTDPALFALVADLPSSVVPLPCIVKNPAYDENLTYVPRSQRPEWATVSLLGKVYVRDDGACTVGQKCKPSATGIATPSTNVNDPYRYHVLARKSANVIRIYVK